MQTPTLIPEGEHRVLFNPIADIHAGGDATKS